MSPDLKKKLVLFLKIYNTCNIKLWYKMESMGRKQNITKFST